MSECQNCGAETKVVIDFRKQPMCNRNLNTKKQFLYEKRYTLKTMFCPECTLVQQAEQLPTSLLFPKTFNYLSNSSLGVISHYSELAEKYRKRFKLKKGDWVVDIGSNTGVSLKPLLKYGINVIGIDPAEEAARIANADGVYTIADEFTNTVDKVIKKVDGKLKMLTGMDVIAHSGDIHSFLEGVKRILKANPKAVFITQSHYLPNVIKHGEWDCLYSEHQRTYTATSLINVFKRHGIWAYDCEENDFYGGSICVFARLDAQQYSINLRNTLKKEKKYGDFKTYEGFAKKVYKSRDDIVKLLDSLKAKGHTIIGLGNPMKSAVLLNFCNIGSETLDVLTERNKMKIGTYSVGTHIPVVDETEYFKTHNPDYCLVLSWNMADIIMKKLREGGYKGSFIVPIPKLKVINYGAKR